ncbi:hypothetical protein BN8_05943 [Fibrisoma limi BUZ 3]|uniref:Uncharacterized protein n=1 Tax=Fibrisoma limi BUZ 3 TaxID=1185876 RepID=I2GRP4_9BACT|nr:hypothetical protein BN8_05943 [Fibrisoma limi BUZ 3]
MNAKLTEYQSHLRVLKLRGLNIGDVGKRYQSHLRVLK